MKSSEVTLQPDKFTYKCLIGDTLLSVAEIIIAYDGVTVIAYNSPEEAGIYLKKMNKNSGLTIE